MALLHHTLHLQIMVIYSLVWLVVVGILHWPLIRLLWPPFLASMLVGLGYAALSLRRASRITSQEIEYANPFQLSPAITFGLIYAIVLVVARAAQVYLGDAGVYLSSAAAGLVSLNAISLSLAGMASRGEVALDLAAQGLVVAVVANTLVKGGFVLSSGAPALRRALWPALTLMAAVAAVVAVVTI